MKDQEKYYGRKELLRYSIIAPLINETNPYPTKREYIKEASKKTYEFNGKSLKFTERTIKGWYYSYLNEGLEVLEKHQRGDKSKFRKIKNDNIVDRIIEIRKEYPRITTKSMYKKLIEEGYMDNTISIHCLFRYLRNNDLKAIEITRKEKESMNKNTQMIVGRVIQQVDHIL